MLVLSRRCNEKVCFPGLRTVIQVLNVTRGTVSLGIEAPPEVAVLRDELQALPVATQRAGPRTGTADCDAGRCLDSVLEFAAAGLERALGWLNAGRIQDTRTFLESMQRDLAELRRLSCPRSDSPDTNPRKMRSGSG
jgi:carbon storage regulator CsrA